MDFLMMTSYLITSIAKERLIRKLIISYGGNISQDS
jgi:hypothetical protein